MQNNDGLCVCFLSGPIAWEMRGKAPGQARNRGDRTGLPAADSLTEPDNTGLPVTTESDF